MHLLFLLYSFRLWRWFCILLTRDSGNPSLCSYLEFVANVLAPPTQYLSEHYSVGPWGKYLYDWEVTALPLNQRAQDRFPVGSISCWDLSEDFHQLKTNIRKLGHICWYLSAIIIIQNYPSFIYGRQYLASVAVYNPRLIKCWKNPWVCKFYEREKHKYRKENLISKFVNK